MTDPNEIWTGRRRRLRSSVPALAALVAAAALAAVLVITWTGPAP